MMDQHLILVPEFDDDHIVTGEPCPNCHCTLFWLDESQGVEVAVWVCLDCGHSEERFEDEDV
jgi:Zn ribbon nucleic-acid-binding protein